MLRTVKTQKIRARLIATKLTTAAAGTSVASPGADDLTLTRAAAGVSDAVFNDAFSRLPIAVGSPDTNVADGGFVSQETTSTLGGISLESHGADETGDDGTLHAFIVGWDSATEDLVIKRHVSTTRHGARILLFKVTGTGTASIDIGSNSGTLTDNGTGDYTIAFKNAFGGTPVCVGCCVNAAQQALTIEASSAASVQVTTWDSSEAAANAVFYLAVIGWRSQNEGGRLRRAIKTPGLKPRMLAFRIANTGTAPSLASADGGVGSEDAAVTDNGAGDYTLTFTKAFAREPIVLVTGDVGDRAQSLAAASSTACQVGTFTEAGVASEGNCDVLVFGFDNADEFQG